MAFKRRTLSFDLEPESIDEASEWLAENVLEIGVERVECTRTRLLFEEMLLEYATHFGTDCKVDAILEKLRGHYRLRFIVEGDRFNPMGADDNDQDSLSYSLFSVLDLRAQYNYAMGKNIVRIPLPRHTVNPVLKILIALIIGTIAGLLGNVFAPTTIETLFIKTVFESIANMWFRLLQAMSGPIIFFTMFTAAFGTRRISDYGGSGFMAIVRYFIVSAVIVVFAMLCSSLVFNINVSDFSTDEKTAASLITDIFNMVPGNLLEPFSTANTPQLLVIAIAAGYALASMGNQASELKAIIHQLNNLGLLITEWVCSLVPYFVGLLLCLKIWSNDTSLLIWIWVPFLIAVGIAVLAFVLFIISTSTRMRVAPLLLARKLSGPFIAALKAGALDYSSVTALAKSCKEQLGIDEVFGNAYLPQGLVLYMPTSAIGIIVFLLFAAQMLDLSVNLIWLLSAAALAVVLAVATPPLNGANLLAFVASFSFLGIDSSVLLDVMVFDIVFGVLSIAFDQALLQLDAITQASHMGFLDEDALRAPVAE